MTKILRREVQITQHSSVVQFHGKTPASGGPEKQYMYVAEGECFTHGYSSFRIGAYPLSPVKAMPRTKFFWNIRKTISGGIETRTEPAMTAW